MNEASDSPVTELWPLRFLEEAESHQGRGNGKSSVALIILNSPISSLDYVQKLYNNASFCVCADGGANRLHDLLVASSSSQTREQALKSVLPNLIHGDLDSLSEHVRTTYEDLGVEVLRDPDQYSTDFGKSINKLIEYRPNVKEILVLGSIGGRIDQGIGLLHELYREQKFRHPNVRFWLFSEASITVMLRPGSTAIHTPLKQGLITRNIGILPVYGRAVIATKGLEWDVQDWVTEMGGMVSTSNHIVEDCIHIHTDVEVLFTVERNALTK